MEYTGRLDDGTVFDTSDEELAKEAGIFNTRRDYKPLCFVLGEGQMIPGFEEGVKDLDEGESTELTISPDEAYGSERDDLVVQVQVDDLKQKGVGDPQVGDGVHLSNGQVGRITEIEDDTAIVDFNHPLAGETLHFEVEVVSRETVE